MEQKQDNQEVLVLEDKKEQKLGVVSEIDPKTGKVKTVAPKDANQEQFLKINSKDGMLKNFMGNFLRQYNDPTRFGLYKIVSDKVEQSVDVLSDMLKNPNEKANANTLETIAVKFDEFTPTREFTPIEESRIDWNQFEAIGVSRQQLEQTGDLAKMLQWQKSANLIPLTLEMGGTSIRTEARLALRENPEGALQVAIHAIKKEPELDRPYMGVKFTDEDKKNLMATGNLGREVELKPSEDNVFKAYVSIDKLTNELLAVRSDRIRIPDEILGVKLSEKQKEELTEGKGVKVEGMTSKRGKEFDAILQVNADKKGFEFIFENTPKFSERKTQTQNQQGSEKFIPQKFCGIEITDKQHYALTQGSTLYLKEMKDKEGQPFNAYVKYSENDNRLRFYKYNPDKSKEQTVAVTEESKTQTAVNNEGKTNEATKNVKEPLKKGQTQPTEKQKEKIEGQKQPKKRGIKR